MPRLFRPARHRQVGRHRRWRAGAAAGVLAAATTLAFSAAPATAAAKPHYHAGTDTATFSVLGVTDANCFLGLGGNEIWIKPGDSIELTSSLLGLSLNHKRLNGLLTNVLGDLLGPLLGAKVTDFKVAGLHVDVTVDKGKTVSVNSTGTHTLRGLSKGVHSLDWSVDSITVLPVLTKLLGGKATGALTTISLDKALGLGATLRTGARLDWHGTIHVTPNADNCALPAVSVPGVELTVGKTKATTPQVNVDPTRGSSSGPISVDTPTGSSPTTGTHSPGTNHNPSNPGPSRGAAPTGSAPSGTGQSTGTARSGGSGHAYPDTGGAGGGGFGNAYPDAGGGLILGNRAGSAPAGQGTASGTVPTSPGQSQHLAAEHGQQESSASLAADLPSPTRMPVLLAVLAIIALALVTATYARLYLLRRS